MPSPPRSIDHAVKGQALYAYVTLRDSSRQNAGMMQELFGNLGEDEPEGGDTRPTLH